MVKTRSGVFTGGIWGINPPNKRLKLVRSNEKPKVLRGLRIGKHMVSRFYNVKVGVDVLFNFKGI